MRNKMAAALSIAFMLLVSSSMACHYWCGGLTGTDPSDSVTNYFVAPGTVITLGGVDTTATYTWTARDENNNVLTPSIPNTVGTATTTWTVPSDTAYKIRYFAIAWTATEGADTACAIGDCIKIKSIPTRCPTYTAFCAGHAPISFVDPFGTVSSPTSDWSGETSLTKTSKIDGFAVTLPYNWNGLAAGDHTAQLIWTKGTPAVYTKACTLTTLHFGDTPAGGVIVTPGS